MASSDMTGRRRAAILAAARSNFERFGFRRARIEEIARDAGIAKGAVYLEFPTKEALLEATVMEVHAESAARFAERLASVHQPAAKIRATLELIFEELARDRFLAKLVAEDPELAVLAPLRSAESSRQAAAAQVKLFEDLARAGIESGELGGWIDIQALPFLLSVLRYVHFHLDVATSGMFPKERVVAMLVDTVMAGLAAAEPPPGSRRKDPRRKHGGRR